MEKAYGERWPITPSVIDLKENINKIRRMEQVHSLGKVETYITEIILTMKEWATEKCIGLMGQCTKENGSKVYSMAKEL